MKTVILKKLNKIRTEPICDVNCNVKKQKLVTKLSRDISSAKKVRYFLKYLHDALDNPLNIGRRSIIIDDELLKAEYKRTKFNKLDLNLAHAAIRFLGGEDDLELTAHLAIPLADIIEKYRGIRNKDSKLIQDKAQLLIVLLQIDKRQSKLRIYLRKLATLTNDRDLAKKIRIIALAKNVSDGLKRIGYSNRDDEDDEDLHIPYPYRIKNLLNTQYYPFRFWKI